MKILFPVYKNVDVLITICLQICKSSVERAANEMPVEFLLSVCAMTTSSRYPVCIYERW